MPLRFAHSPSKSLKLLSQQPRRSGSQLVLTAGLVIPWKLLMSMWITSGLVSLITLILSLSWILIIMYVIIPLATTNLTNMIFRICTSTCHHHLGLNPLVYSPCLRLSCCRYFHFTFLLLVLPFQVIFHCQIQLRVWLFLSWASPFCPSSVAFQTPTTTTTITTRLVVV